MKVLYVYGDDDYAALTFEDDLHLDNDADLKRLWNKSMDAGLADEYAYAEVEVVEDSEIYCQALEFGAVDSRFVQWVKQDVEFLDYDESKHRNFYVVEE